LRVEKGLFTLTRACGSCTGGGRALFEKRVGSASSGRAKRGAVEVTKEEKRSVLSPGRRRARTAYRREKRLLAVS